MPQELRYVVLRHEGVPEPHFDLMIEHGAAHGLMTWRSPVWPIHQTVQLQALGEHRRDYLDYEGPVSGGRGYVRRVAAGTYLLSIDEQRQTLTLEFQTGPDRPTLVIESGGRCTPASAIKKVAWTSRHSTPPREGGL